MRKAVLPFVLFTDQDRDRREHEYRNRAGVGRFLKEFAGLKEDDRYYQYYEGKFQNRIWFKKMQFLNPPGPARDAAAQNHEDTSGYRYILIDDEHSLGWSFGLYTGLFGRSDQVGPKFFETNRCRLETPDKNLLCIATPEEASKFFTDNAKELEKILNEWVGVEEGDEGDVNQQRELARRRMEELLPYHVVFLDLRLEPEDEERPIAQTKGLEILKLIKENFPELPVIMLTASRQAISEMEARKYGVDAYWIKNVSSGKELRQAIRKCLKKAELREIWRAIRMVEKKESLNYYYREEPQNSLKTEVLDELNRQLVQRLLRESFQLLWEGEEARRPMHSEDHPYDLVIIDMGLIQELRLEVERNYSGVPFEEQEKKLRSRRNAMVHPGHGRPANFDEAVGFVKFTLNRLLGWELFNNPI